MDFDLKRISVFIQDTLNITYKHKMTKDIALKFLNRPLRVCGVVKNEGEPGGGPYIVDNGNYLDLQICEASEINMNDEQQTEIFNASEYFNPVDLVCFVKDYKGNKFNLLDYTNEDRYFISEKSYEGKPLKALEHPGLWNGGMHNWNTLFVEVPLSTEYGDGFRPLVRKASSILLIYRRNHKIKRTEPIMSSVLTPKK